jgi:hypothetical protein
MVTTNGVHHVDDAKTKKNKAGSMYKCDQCLYQVHKECAIIKNRNGEEEVTCESNKQNAHDTSSSTMTDDDSSYWKRLITTE